MLTKWLNYMVSQKLNTKEKILLAAKNILTVKGKDGTSMQEIADLAGINKAMLHYYFKNKDLLFEEVFVVEVKKFAPILKEKIAADLNLFDKIHSICEAYILMATANPYLPLFVISELNKQPELFILKVFDGEVPDFKKFGEQINKEVKLGIIKKVHPQHLIMNIMSMSVFPFLFKPIFQIGMQIEPEVYNNLMIQRIKEVPKFIIDSIKI